MNKLPPVVLLAASLWPAMSFAFVPDTVVLLADFGAEPTSYFLVGVALERGDDNLVGRDLLGDQLVGVTMMYRSDDVAIGGRLMVSPKIQRNNLFELRGLLGFDLRYHYDYGVEWSFGVGLTGEARLADHFMLLYATPLEIGAKVYDDGGLEIRLFLGARYLVLGSLLNTFLIDPNGFDNENAQDALQNERDHPLELFVRIGFGRRID